MIQAFPILSETFKKVFLVWTFVEVGHFSQTPCAFYYFIEHRNYEKLPEVMKINFVSKYKIGCPVLTICHFPVAMINRNKVKRTSLDKLSSMFLIIALCWPNCTKNKLIVAANTVLNQVIIWLIWGQLSQNPCYFSTSMLMSNEGLKSLYNFERGFTQFSLCRILHFLSQVIWRFIMIIK